MLTFDSTGYVDLMTPAGTGIAGVVYNYDGNIYDEALSIEFLCKIRDQIKFKSIEELKNQINEDKITAKELRKLYE